MWFVSLITSNKIKQGSNEGSSKEHFFLSNLIQSTTYYVLLVCCKVKWVQDQLIPLKSCMIFFYSVNVVITETSVSVNLSTVHPSLLSHNVWKNNDRVTAETCCIRHTWLSLRERSFNKRYIPAHTPLTICLSALAPKEGDQRKRRVTR